MSRKAGKSWCMCAFVYPQGVPLRLYDFASQWPPVDHHWSLLTEKSRLDCAVAVFSNSGNG